MAENTDKIKQSFDKINNEMKLGFSSAIALSELASSEDICQLIKKIKKWQLKTK